MTIQKNLKKYLTWVDFPGGEPHVKIDPQIHGADVEITARISCFNHIGRLLVLTDALRRTGTKNIEVNIPYFPGARQDRVANPGEALTVKVYADIINAQNYNKVRIADPHSDVTPALINNVRVISQEHILLQLNAEFSGYKLIAPDAGAIKKFNSLLGRYDCIQCTKHRDTLTGELSHFKVHAADLSGQNCLIVDDICDGGRTFTALAQTLKEKGAKSVSLYVTHGIFSKGFTDLRQHIDRIVTTNSFRKTYASDDGRLTILDIFPENDI